MPEPRLDGLRVSARCDRQSCVNVAKILDPDLGDPSGTAVALERTPKNARGGWTAERGCEDGAAVGPVPAAGEAGFRLKHPCLTKRARSYVR